MKTTQKTGLALMGLAFALAGCVEDRAEPLRSSVQNLEVVCVEDDAPLDEGAWRCGEPLTVECTSADETGVDEIFAEPGAEGATCEDSALSLSDEGPFEVGEHEIVVSNDEGELCRSTLTVEDTTAPEAEGQALLIWPPNHKFHTIAPEDCVQVTDACDDDVSIQLLWATSDEPFNARGDGNTEPDIEFGCEGVKLRAERQGGSNGRVYTIGWRVEDDEGNAEEGTCTVSVAHDQGRDNGAIDDGEAERVESEDDNEDCEDDSDDDDGEVVE